MASVYPFVKSFWGHIQILGLLEKSGRQMFPLSPEGPWVYALSSGLEWGVCRPELPDVSPAHGGAPSQNRAYPWEPELWDAHGGTGPPGASVPTGLSDRPSGFLITQFDLTRWFLVSLYIEESQLTHFSTTSTFRSTCKQAGISPILKEDKKTKSNPTPHDL